MNATTVTKLQYMNAALLSISSIPIWKNWGIIWDFEHPNYMTHPWSVGYKGRWELQRRSINVKAIIRETGIYVHFIPSPCLICIKKSYCIFCRCIISSRSLTPNSICPVSFTRSIFVKFWPLSLFSFVFLWKQSIDLKMLWLTCFSHLKEKREREREVRTALDSSRDSILGTNVHAL